MAAGRSPMAWKAQGLGAGFSSLSIAGDRIFTMGDRGDSQYVIALNLADGKEIWSTRIGPAWDDGETGGPRATPTIDGDSVFVEGTEGQVVCLDRATGAIRWQKSITRDYNGQMMSIWKWAESPLVDGDRLLFTPGNYDAMVVAVNKRTGKDIWRAEVGRINGNGSNGAGYSSVIPSDGAGVHQYIQLGSGQRQ